jgi:hypothetical protein
MNKPKVAEAMRTTKQLADTMRQEFEQSLPARIERYLNAGKPWLIPNHHFAAVSAECCLLFRDGHFYGCIALAQAVAEAIASFLCRCHGWSPRQNFETNIETLFRRAFISKQLHDNFLKIWKGRNDYHHLNPTILLEKQKLEILARKNINLLGKIEEELFAINLRNGKIVPRNPKYWEGCNDEARIQADSTREWKVYQPKKATVTPN